MAIRPIPKLHKGLRDVQGSGGSHAFGLVGLQGLLTTAAPGVGTILLVNGRIYLTPFYVPRFRPFVGANLRVTTAGTAGALIRFGVYGTNPAAPQPSGGALMFDCGTLAGDALALLSFPMPGGSLTLDEGIYWFAVVGQGSPATQATVSSATGRNPFFCPAGDPAFTDLVGFRSIAATHLGALPDPCPTAVSDTTGMPRITMQ